jgi:hypothetical protein
VTGVTNPPAKIMKAQSVISVTETIAVRKYIQSQHHVICRPYAGIMRRTRK